MWSTSRLLKDENYSFEMVVLNICNNLVSGSSIFTTVRVIDKTYRISKVIKTVMGIREDLGEKEMEEKIFNK